MGPHSSNPKCGCIPRAPISLHQKVLRTELPVCPQEGETWGFRRPTRDSGTEAQASWPLGKEREKSISGPWRWRLKRPIILVYLRRELGHLGDFFLGFSACFTPMNGNLPPLPSRDAKGRPFSKRWCFLLGTRCPIFGEMR